jgi:hypothetical protein
MSIEWRVIENREQWLDWRSEDMTASVAACLWGMDIHPYTTAYQQWAFHSGLWVPPPINPKLARRADYVEKIAPDLIREERPEWDVGPNEHYYRDPDERIGATPDIEARRRDIEGIGVIDVKSLGSRAFRRWKDRDTGETAVPLWMAIQVNIQAGFRGATWGAVAPITIDDSGLDIEIIDVPIRPDVFQSFRAHAAEFWRRVREKEPYDIDWGKDAPTILDIWGDDDGSVVDLTGVPEFEMAVMQREDFKRLEREGAEAEKRRKLLDAMIIHKMANARSARCKFGLVTRRTIHVKEAVRKAYSFPRISVQRYAAPEDRSSLAGEAT